MINQRVQISLHSSLHTFCWQLKCRHFLTFYLTCATPFDGSVPAEVDAAVITPPDTRSTVVPGFESCDDAGKDFSVLSDIFTSDACPPEAAFKN